MHVPTTWKIAMTVVPALQPGGEQQGLHADRRQHQEVVAGERRVRRPQVVGADDQREHRRAEQAGPGLLQPEQQELVGPGAEPRALRPGPDARVHGDDAGLDPILETHRR
jgi:hypothetical protein